MSWAAIAIVITVLLAYGDSLRLPFFYDDLQHLVWLHGQSLGSIFVSAADRPYYRPMQFFAWKLYEVIFGVDSALVYHGLNLVLHVLNGLLVVSLVRRLTPRPDRWWPAILTGLIFVTFPFAYQVVPLPASLTHPMATMFVLLALLTYDRFQFSGHRRWLITALGCGLVAFISNEGSILLGGLIALWIFIRSPQEKRWRWVGLFIALAAIYYLWYQSRQADSSGTLTLRNPETITQNAIYILQGLSIPLQPFGQALMNFGASDQAAASIAALIALGSVAVVLWRTHMFHRFVFAVGWYGLCAAPAILLLSHNYLINSPRLMYLGFVGAAWLWASVVEVVWDLHWPTLVRRLTTLAVAAGILIPPFIFVRERMNLYMLTVTPIQSVIDVVRRSHPTDRLLFINLPAWLGPSRSWYPIGHEGVLFLQKSISMNDFLLANIGRSVPAKAIEFDNLSAPQPYYYGIYGPSLDWAPLNVQVRAADNVYLTIYSPQSIDLVEAGRILKAPSSSENTVATFGGSLILENPVWSMCANRLKVTLNWLTSQVVPGNLAIFVHILNSDGTLVAQHDSPPLMGLMPFWQWQVGDRVEDNHPIDLSALSDNQSYTIAIGLYDSGTGQRLSATLVNGDQPSDNAVPIGSFILNSDRQSCTAN